MAQVSRLRSEAKQGDPMNRKMKVSRRDFDREVVPDLDPDTHYLEQPGFEDRLAEWKRGKFGFIGVRAVVNVPIHGIIQQLTSGGLWGIEDDSDMAYIKEVYAGECDQLAEILEALGFE